MGRKDQFGVLQPHKSLKYLLGSCRDFQEEESLLQTRERKMGILVDRTPKCHWKLVGEGIEYSWGCIKFFYRFLPLKEKKSKETLKPSMRKSLCNTNNLTLDRIRAFSRQATQYMLAYYALHQQKQKQQAIGIWAANNLATLKASQLTTVKIEQMVKQFKTHHCIVDFDSTFIKLVIVKKDNYFYYYYYFRCWHCCPRWSELKK
jgi:hypothetical protein